MPQSQVDVWVKALPMAALFIGIDERILAVNDEVKNVLPQNIIDRSYITALRQPSALTCIADCLKSKAPQSTDFVSTQRQSDATYMLQCRHIDGDTPGVLLTFTDVSAAQKTSQLHRDFVANVSHELRSPLTSLIGFIETLQGPAKSDPQAQTRFLQIMAAETARMNRLVDDLLSLSRVEAQERQRPTDEIDMTALLHAVMGSFVDTGAIEAGDISLRNTALMINVQGDSDQLRQVFTNLIENAIKYGGQGVQVVLTLQAPAFDTRLCARAIRISVRDTGDGFNPVHAARLTERFYRIDSHRSREMGGTGLGLAIVKHIISRHRGRLEITSTPGKGSEFTVILPFKNG